MFMEKITVLTGICVFTEDYSQKNDRWSLIGGS